LNDNADQSREQHAHQNSSIHELMHANDNIFSHPLPIDKLGKTYESAKVSDNADKIDDEDIDKYINHNFMTNASKSSHNCSQSQDPNDTENNIGNVHRDNSNGNGTNGGGSPLTDHEEPFDNLVALFRSKINNF